MKVKVKISVSSDDEETLKYPCVQIQIEIGNRNPRVNPFIENSRPPQILRMKYLDLLIVFLKRCWKFMSESLCKCNVNVMQCKCNVKCKCKLRHL